MTRKILYILFACLMCLAFCVGCGRNDNSVLLDEETLSQNSQSTQAEETDDGGIFVYITGAVKHPGVYEVRSGARLYEVLDMAGGMTQDARKDCLNLAEVVDDGEQIKVLTKRQYKKSKKQSSGSLMEDEASDGSGLIDINSATAESLTQLPGIGEVKAAAIVAYREENGSFSAIEDIKNVSGIGDATFENIMSLITVG